MLRQVQCHRPDVVLLDLDMPEGGRHIDNELFVQAMTSYSPPTEREHDVLECTLQGLTVVQTSEALHLPTGSVRDHLSSAVQKTAAPPTWGSRIPTPVRGNR